jgi:hypothetical protein
MCGRASSFFHALPAARTSLSITVGAVNTGMIPNIAHLGPPEYY